MSAFRDTSQKVAYCGSNLYRIYRERSTEQPKITAFEPLKRNLEELDRLHAELKEILDELEELVKE